MNATDSRLFKFLRFPMMCGIICIHSDFRLSCDWMTQADMPVFNTMMDKYCEVVCVTFMFVFFFISGFLFFKESEFNLSLYKEKLSKRVRSLLIPYIIWIAIYFVVILVLQLVKPDLLFIIHKPISSFSPTDYLWMFWDIRQISPLNIMPEPLVGQFWFLQCLFVLSILSPLIWFVIKRTYIMLPLLLALAFFTDFIPIMPGVQAMAYSFFTLGAFFAIHKVSVSAFVSRFRPYIYLLFLGTFFFTHHHFLIYWLCDFCLMFVLFDVARWFVSRDFSMPAVLVASSFFLFAIHRFFTGLTTNMARFEIVPLRSEAACFAYYLVACLLVIAVSVGIYILMSRWLPRVTACLSGGRTHHPTPNTHHLTPIT